MSEIYRICGLALIAITLSAVLKTKGSSVAPYIPQITAIVIFITAVASLTPVITFIYGLVNGQAVESNTVYLIISASVIALIFRTISELCRENGENMLKNAVEFAGNTEIMLLSLPLLKELLSKTAEILKI